MSMRTRIIGVATLHIDCQDIGWSARVVPWAPLDARMKAFATEVMQDSAPPPNLLTSTWTPEAATGMDTKGEQPLVTTSFLRNCEGNEPKNVTWQLNGGFLDLLIVHKRCRF